MTAILAALGASVAWGASDFVAGLQARRLPVLSVMIVSQGFAMVILAVALIAAKPGAIGPGAVAWAAGAGLVVAVALGCFFRALATGKMSIVAPVTATGTAIPVIVGIAGGDTLSAVQVTGIALAVVGVVLAGREQGNVGEQVNRNSFGLALIAAVGFGLYFTFMAEAAKDGVLWPLAVQRASVVLCLCVALLASPSLSLAPPLKVVPVLLGIGVLDLAANTLFTFATTKGELSIVAVLGSLFPVMTVFLAYFFLRERLAAVQFAGTTLTLVGVILLAASA